MSKKFFSTTLVFLFVGLVSLIGCNAGPEIFVGPAINAYVFWAQGEGHTYYKFNAKLVEKSLKRTANDLGYKIDKEESKDDKVTLHLSSTNNKFKVTVRKIEPEITKMSIRVDFLGDRPYAEMIFNSVEKNLNTIEFDGNGKVVKSNGI